MKLFIVGPTEIEQDILELGALPQVYMRTPAFSNRLHKELQERYEIEIAPSGGDLATKMFRIGNFGNINKNDIDDLVNKIQTIISEI